MSLGGGSDEQGRPSGAPLPYRCERCEHDFVSLEARCPKCLRVTTIVARKVTPAAAPPPPPDEWQRASVDQYESAHRVANAVLLGLMVPAHGIVLLAVLINVIQIAAGNTPMPDDAAGQAGFFSAFSCITVWGLAGLPWAMLCAVGIAMKKSWATTLAIAYWAFSCIACCPVPVAAYAIWWLARTKQRERLSGARAR